MLRLNEVVNLFDIETLENETSFVETKGKRNDGLYRPELKDVTDKTKGYVSTLRFLPNYVEQHPITGKPGWGSSSIEKTLHWIKGVDDNLNGYYDGQAFTGEKCPLNTLYWRLKNSKNAADNEKAELVSGTKKFYSYVLILEDVQHPELVGKIMVFPYGFKIKEKIENEKTGNGAAGIPTNVFDPANNGMDFRFIMKQIGQFPNYDSSTFKTNSPMKIWDSKNNVFKTIPVTFDEGKQKNVVTNPDVQRKIVEFLLTREHTIEENLPKVWDDTTKEKVSRIIQLLTNSQSYSNTMTKSSTKIVETEETNDEVDKTLDGFFNDDVD